MYTTCSDRREEYGEDIIGSPQVVNRRNNDNPIIERRQQLRAVLSETAKCSFDETGKHLPQSRRQGIDTNEPDLRDIGRIAPRTPTIRQRLSISNNSSLASHEVTSGIGGAGAGGGGDGRRLKGDALASSGNHNPPRVDSISPGRGGSVASSGGPIGKKRNFVLSGFDSSPGSIEEVEDAELHEEKKRQPVKRACNECRQQKLRCDVVQEPFTTCSRCRRLKLDCKIEFNFKRIRKRSRHAEMEREIVELRKQVATATTTSMPLQSQVTPGKKEVYQTPPGLSNVDQYMGSHEAVASLLDLRSGFDGSSYMRSSSHQFKRIEDVTVSVERATELFKLFFAFYNPFLPFLDQDRSPEQYYSTSPLLFWTIISIGARRSKADVQLLTTLAGPVMRLVWSTLADIPQSYHVVKALCLLCTWPFPTSSTSTDPTFMLCGIMMQVAMQLGLHRPSHARDFTKFRVELIESELRDKVRTWAVCNIVAQRVATGYGQPPSTLYDWTLSVGESGDINFTLPPEVKVRLEIEKFNDKVTKALYNNHRDPVGLSNDKERSTLISFLSNDFNDLAIQLGPKKDAITNLYLLAAHLHLHLSAFFDNRTAKDYRQRLLSLHVATTSFLEAALKLETDVGPVLVYTPYYVYQMVLAGGFTLLKLCKSFFAWHIDLDYSKDLFNQTIWAIRKISVATNDLPQRLAEVLAQMWRLGDPLTQRTASCSDVDDSLQLKVRCRMSMSLVYDSVWRWREDTQTKDCNLEAYLKNPTNPDSTADSSTASSVAPLRTSSSTPGGDPSLAPPPPLPPNLGLSAAHDVVGVGAANGPFEPNYEVFDPLNWLLDGLVDFPYSYPMQGLETQGMA